MLSVGLSIHGCCLIQTIGVLTTMWTLFTCYLNWEFTHGVYGIPGYGRESPCGKKGGMVWLVNSQFPLCR